MFAKKTRMVGLSVAAATMALPVVLAAPAQAITWHDGCSLTTTPAEFRSTWNSARDQGGVLPLPPRLPPPAQRRQHQRRGGGLHPGAGPRRAAGDVDADGIDNADEDVIGKATKTLNYGTLGGNSVVDIRGLLPRTDTDLNDEVYSKVRFRVTSGFVPGSWSGYELVPPPPASGGRDLGRHRLRGTGSRTLGPVSDRPTR